MPDPWSCSLCDTLGGEGANKPSCLAGRDVVAGAASIPRGPSSGVAISTSRAVIPQVNPAELGCDPAQVGIMVFSAKAVQVSNCVAQCCGSMPGREWQQLYLGMLVKPQQLWQRMLML